MKSIQFEQSRKDNIIHLLFECEPYNLFGYKYLNAYKIYHLEMIYDFIIYEIIFMILTFTLNSKQSLKHLFLLYTFKFRKSI